MFSMHSHSLNSKKSEQNHSTKRSPRELGLTARELQGWYR
ncbi:hypothetical protein FGIG_09910 [Fasciola gigantica]|uniref:Uncharacterized protein n=1 Tax=Fasciola gigantica TaxID=46835 RepID=A0A504YKN8_FASGI|nr:hypothetical protein FGIG_09910 [Fasciola gigantica]